MYKRSCPMCNREVIHKNETSLKNSIKNNKRCRFCSRNARPRIVPVRNCPKCNDLIVYMGTSARWQGDRNGSLCRSCSHKKPYSELKKCFKCEETKLREAFHKNKSRSDGLCHVCKVCAAEKFQTDIQFRIRKALRARVYIAIYGNQKAGSAVRDLGCSIEELKQYLEQQFYPNPETRRTNDLG